MARRLERAMAEARALGCDPSTYQRGPLVRVHLNRARNTWEDVQTYDEAAAWLEARCRDLRAGKVLP